MDRSIEYDRAVLFGFFDLVNIVFALVAWLDERRQQHLALEMTP